MTTILTLAAERPTSELSVTEVAREAGVHRSTFYQHAPDTTSLLAGVIRSQLDRPSTASSAPDRSLSWLISHVTEHVRQHQAVYETSLRDPGSATRLLDVLTAFSRDHLTGAGRPPNPSATLVSALITAAIHLELLAGRPPSARAIVGHLQETAVELQAASTR
ncbi:TetR family transcriptional regulator [Plantibacter flavus]|uniref:TetR/AcrR family transcriptional regulator n=1 Tax=Plantibacter flavus TaxID=150123 RepID=UPI003F18ACC2